MNIPTHMQTAEFACSDLFDLLTQAFISLQEPPCGETVYELTCRLAPISIAWRQGVHAARGKMTKVVFHYRSSFVTNEVLLHVARACPMMRQIELVALSAPNNLLSGLTAIAKSCSSLAALDISGRGDDAWLLPFARHAKNLKAVSFNLWDEDGYASRGQADCALVALATGCPQVRSLDINGVTDNAVSFVRKALLELQFFSLSNSALTDAFLEAPWPRLRFLELQGLEEMTAEGLAWLQAPMLEQLRVSSVIGAAGGLASAAFRTTASRLPRLKELSLESCEVEDADLAALAASLPRLEELSLDVCHRRSNPRPWMEASEPGSELNVCGSCRCDRATLGMWVSRRSRSAARGSLSSSSRWKKGARSRLPPSVPWRACRSKSSTSCAQR
jgi:hypothetical protein